MGQGRMVAVDVPREGPYVLGNLEDTHRRHKPPSTSVCTTESGLTSLMTRSDIATSTRIGGKGVEEEMQANLGVGGCGQGGRAWRYLPVDLKPQMDWQETGTACVNHMHDSGCKQARRWTKLLSERSPVTGRHALTTELNRNSTSRPPLVELGLLRRKNGID